MGELSDYLLIFVIVVAIVQTIRNIRLLYELRELYGQLPKLSENRGKLSNLKNSVVAGDF